MKPPTLSFETIHASCIAIGGGAVLLAGRSGSGKSDLALRLIDRGATLVSDDYTYLKRTDGRLLAGPPANIAGRIEVRGVGLVELEHVAEVPVVLIVELDQPPQRMPSGGETRNIAGIAVPAIALSGLEASAPLKVEAAARLCRLT